MLCLDEQFLLFEDARWQKNRPKKNLGQPRGTLKGYFFVRHTSRVLRGALTSILFR